MKAVELAGNNTHKYLVLIMSPDVPKIVTRKKDVKKILTTRHHIAILFE